MLSIRDIIRASERGRADPVWWVERFLGKKPYDYQAALLEAVRDHRLVSFRSCHGVGKTGCAGGMVVPWFLCNFYESEVITTAPTFRQVEGTVWKEIRRAHNEAKVPLGGKPLKSHWELGPAWFAWGFTTDATKPDKFQGFHPVSGHGLVVADEAAGIEQKLYDEGISSIISSGDSRLLLTGNPTSPVGEFRDSHRRGSGYVRLKVDAFQTPNFAHFGITPEDIVNGTWRDKIGGDPLPAPWLVSPEWVAGRYRRWGPDSPLYQARVLAEFPTSSEWSLIPMSWLETARQQDLETGGAPFDGVDIAYGGADSMVHGRAWPSGRYRKVAEYRGEASKHAADQIDRELVTSGSDMPSHVTIDAVGVGAGVYTELCKRDYWCPGADAPVDFVEFMSGHSADDKIPLEGEFYNKRAQGYWFLRKQFEAGRIDIDPRDEDLYYQLSEIRFEIDNRGRIKIEPKDKYKERVGVSPDDADAMMMTFYPNTGGVVIV